MRERLGVVLKLRTLLLLGFLCVSVPGCCAGLRNSVKGYATGNKFGGQLIHKVADDIKCDPTCPECRANVELIRKIAQSIVDSARKVLEE